MSESELRTLIRQLQGALDGKSLRIGTATLTYSASATSAAATVTHELGTTPTHINSIGTTGLGKLHVVNYVSGSRNATDFQLQSETRDGAAVTGAISVFWVVFG